MILEEKGSRRQKCILQAVAEALTEYEYHQLTIEDVAARAGWVSPPFTAGGNISLNWFWIPSEHIPRLFLIWIFSRSLEDNLVQQLIRLSQALDHPVGRALLVVMANHRELAGEFLQYLLPRREQMRGLIQQAIERGEIRADYNFELMLDCLYGPIHYQIIFLTKCRMRIIFARWLH